LAGPASVFAPPCRTISDVQALRRPSARPRSACRARVHPAGIPCAGSALRRAGTDRGRAVPAASRRRRARGRPTRTVPTFGSSVSRMQSARRLAIANAAPCVRTTGRRGSGRRPRLRSRTA
jgi:hypothetical protein